MKSDVLMKYPTLYRFQFPCDIHLHLDEMHLIKRFWTLLKTFLKYRKSYDIFHFNLGSTFFGSSLSPTKLGFLDLPLYPKKAKLFVTFNGCEARQKFTIMKMKPICACKEVNCQNNYCFSPKVDYHNARSIKKLAKYTNHMWAFNPDVLHFLPKEKSSFLPYAVYKFDQKVSFPKLKKKIIVAHAPSNRVAKGTKYILFAMEKLIKKYPDLINFKLIENLPHEEALAIYNEADLIIDQLLIGWYGSFAVEVMLMGKPVIVRIDEEDLKFIPQNMAKELMKTIINANPYNIYDVLERCIQDRELLMKHAQASIEYARKWHNPKYVASLTKEKYEQ